MTEPVVVAEHLTKVYRSGHRVVRALDQRELRRAARPDAGRHRRERVRQVHPDPADHRAGRADRGPHPDQRRARPAAVRAPGQRAADLPGPGRVAEPVPEDLEERGRAAPPPGPQGPPRGGGRDADQGRHRPGPARRPAGPVQRRPAAARRHRADPGRPGRRAAVRRADLGAGRVGAGPDPQPAPSAAAGDRLHLRLRHPRPGRRAGGRRPHHGAAGRAGPRARGRGGVLRRPARPYSRALIAATGRRRQPTGASTPGEDGT